MMKYETGLEVFLRDKYRIVKGKRVGLVTNHTGLTSNLRSNIDLFYHHPEIKLVALYSPEHGIHGNAKDRAKINDSIDSYIGLPIYSLYGNYTKPERSVLEDIDVLIFDIQDIGLRYYTYISTMFYCLEACAENHIQFIVLDRLNPLGRKVEGNLLQNKLKSFEGLYPLPQRHGMTVGELALWANNDFDINAELEIVKLEGWQGEYFDQFDLVWVPPSPNIPHFNTALVYPITVFMEGTNISEGRGTTKPFEYIGAPWIDPYLLAKKLNEKNDPGVFFRPVYFIPTFSKYVGVECGGVHVIVQDRNIINNNFTSLNILKTIMKLYPDKIKWIKHDNDDRYFIDLIFGTNQVRKKLETEVRVIDIINSWQDEIKKFISIRNKYLLY